MAAAWASRASRSAFKDIVAATRRTNAASSRLSRASVRDCSLSFIAARQVKADASNVAEASAVALSRQELQALRRTGHGRAAGLRIPGSCAARRYGTKDGFAASSADHSLRMAWKREEWRFDLPQDEPSPCSTMVFIAASASSIVRTMRRPGSLAAAGESWRPFPRWRRPSPPFATAPWLPIQLPKVHPLAPLQAECRVEIRAQKIVLDLCRFREEMDEPVAECHGAAVAVV